MRSIKARVVARWVDSGAAKGDPKDLPAPKGWPNDQSWNLASMFGQTNDSSGDGGGGDRCCWTTALVRVNVE